MGSSPYRDKKVVGVFVRFVRRFSYEQYNRQIRMSLYASADRTMILWHRRV
jgi:hypothetical protein